MASYSDERSSASDDGFAAAPLTPYSDGEMEKSLLDRTSETDSEQGHEDEKHARVQSYQSALRSTPRSHVLLFLALAAVIIVIIISQLFVPMPAESAKKYHKAHNYNYPTPDPENWHVQPEERAPQDYVLTVDWDFGAPPQRRVYDWTVQDVVKHPDGVFRPMMVINGQFPGPMIEVNEGDTIVVNVQNQAENATTIHWHGIYQNGTNHMDGTVGITQCPIAPGTNFTYEFTVDNQYGTYWYHSHHGVQVADGMMGPLVIHSKTEEDLQEKKYASDRVVMVSDHYYDSSNELLMHYLQSNKENAEPTPDTALINGKGVRDCSLYPERKCDNSTVQFPQFNMEPNLRHRIRLINTGAFAEFQVTLDEHPFEIIEVDGTVVSSPKYDRLNINPAQRYSMLIDTTQEKDNFWFRAKMLTACFQNPDSRMNTEARAIVNYAEPDAKFVEHNPQSIDLAGGPDLECRDMNMTEIISIPAMEPPATANETFYLRSNFEIGAWRLSRGKFNTSTFRPDVQHPSLHRVLDGIANDDPAFTNQITGVNTVAFERDTELVLQTTGVQTIDLVVSNFDDGNHPLHLHGYKFWVLAQGHGYPPADLYDHLDLRNPIRRDTASVEAFGWTLLRVLADNPGAWAFHCHVSWHAEAGLAMQLLSRVDMLGNYTLPQQNRALCEAPREVLLSGGTPEDSVFMNDDEH